MLRIAVQTVWVVFLTLLTQIGGLAWLIALLFRRRLAVFALAYAGLSVGALWAAPLMGRVPLSCLADGPLQVGSRVYCALNRNFVTPAMKTVLIDTAEAVDKAFPGTQTLVLDANFPFLDGFPLLPHLSHDDGEKVDLAFYYRDASGYLPGRTRSPVGYFAFEDGPTQCPEALLSLRWDFAALQPLWPDLAPEPERLRFVVGQLVGNERVGRIFLEPHLVERFALADPKIRFHGCRAARHDDHLHFDLRAQP